MLTMALFWDRGWIPTVATHARNVCSHITLWWFGWKVSTSFVHSNRAMCSLLISSWALVCSLSLMNLRLQRKTPTVFQRAYNLGCQVTLQELPVLCQRWYFILFVKPIKEEAEELEESLKRVFRCFLGRWTTNLNQEWKLLPKKLCH